MKFQYIDQKNFPLYCAKMYSNPQCSSVEEYNRDLELMDTIRKLLTKLTKNSGKVNLRLLTNHIVVFNNLFGNVPACRILMLFCPDFTHTNLLTIMSWLNILPETIPEYKLSEYILNKELKQKLELL